MRKTFKYTIYISNKHCASISWLFEFELPDLLLFYFLLTWCFTDIDLFIGLWLFLRLPLFSILFYLCQTIHTRNNKTKIHTRNNETKKHASFKLTFRNMDYKWYVCCTCHNILSSLFIATIIGSYRYVLK